LPITARGHLARNEWLHRQLPRRLRRIFDDDNDPDNDNDSDDNNDDVLYPTHPGSTDRSRNQRSLQQAAECGHPSQ